MRSKIDFANGVMKAYRAGSTRSAEVTLAKSMDSSGLTTRAMGHPAFARLAPGETATCDLAVAFLDLRQFTARTFWDPLEDVVRLAHAVLTQVVAVVESFGGYPLGLRGDGVFVGFGGPGPSDPAIDVALALGAISYSLDATRGSLNNLLRLAGLDPVQLRAGADHGTVAFTQTGSAGSSEINVIGYQANFAAKAEKIAHSWELVAGDGLVSHIANTNLYDAHAFSPQRYERRGHVKTYPFYDVHWQRLLPHLDSIPAELAGSPTTSIRPY